MRPDQFRQIEPYRAPCDDKAFGQGLRPLSANCATVLLIRVICVIRGRSFHFRKQKIAKRYKKPDCVFLSSVTQATDWTITGCKAHRAAPSHAPRIPSCRKTCQSTTADPACKSTFRR